YLVARSAPAHSKVHKTRNPSEAGDRCFRIRDTARPLIPGRPSTRPPDSPSPQSNGHVLAILPGAPDTLTPRRLRPSRSRRLQTRSTKAPPIDQWQRSENRSLKQLQSTLPSVPIRRQFLALRPRAPLTLRFRVCRVKYGLSE